MQSSIHWPLEVLCLQGPGPSNTELEEEPHQIFRCIGKVEDTRELRFHPPGVGHACFVLLQGRRRHLLEERLK
eukprot:8958728-Lingulodinium_polyedra.AAC.1